MDHRDSQEWKETWDHLDLKDPLEPQEKMEYLVEMVKRGIVDLLEGQERKDQGEIQVYQAMLELREVQEKREMQVQGCVLLFLVHNNNFSLVYTTWNLT